MQLWLEESSIPILEYFHTQQCSEPILSVTPYLCKPCNQMDGIISATHANTQMTHPPKGLKPNMHEKQRPACKVESSPSSNRARDTQIHMILWWLGFVFAFPSSHYCFCILTHVHLYVIIPSSLCACICRPSNQLILFPRACMCADLYSFVFSLKPVIVVDVMQLLRLRNK